MDTFEIVKKIICEKSGVDEQQITLETNFIMDLKVDSQEITLETNSVIDLKVGSLDLTQLFFKLEDRFNIKIDYNDFIINFINKTIQTVKDLVEYLEKRLEKPQKQPRSRK